MPLKVHLSEANVWLIGCPRFKKTELIETDFLTPRSCLPVRVVQDRVISNQDDSHSWVNGAENGENSLCLMGGIRPVLKKNRLDARSIREVGEFGCHHPT